MKNIIFLFIYLLLQLKAIHAQEFKPHIGLNLNGATQILSLSPVGLRVYGDLMFENQFNLRTNLAANAHGINDNSEVKSIGNCFYFQLEESVVYLTDKSDSPLFFGAGIGYYSIKNNEESDHLYQPNPFNSNYWLGHDNFDSNIGIHFLIGADTGKLIWELKYTYTVFAHNRFFQRSVNSVSTQGIETKNETFHFFALSLSI
ncbi:MAG: hypothetical protein KDC52_19915 [Ignavibacteriae bacterium]|nr:hypothetical protein [Ignavibacteriota bacterium]MCB0753750.1 hypothetical protein [Ignavibacteriota bacterium]